MTTEVAIHHRSAYHFDRSTVIMPHVVRLRPAPHCRTPISEYSLSVTPDKHFIHWQQDPFSNYSARLIFTKLADELVFDVNLKARLEPYNPFDFFVDEDAFEFPFRYEAELIKDVGPYLFISERGARLKAFVKSIGHDKQDTVNFLVQVNRRVHEEISHVHRMEHGVLTCEETLKSQSGSCRDSAWLLIQVYRHLGLVTRFVSGYQVLLKETTSAEGTSPVLEDRVDLHAWVEVFVPGAGWIGLDPSAGLMAAENYIPLACTPNPESAAPIDGKTTISDTHFEYHSTVIRL